MVTKWWYFCRATVHSNPCAKGIGFPEPDGLDEIFLPRDVGKWQDDGSGGEVPNAISDNEIAVWLQNIRAKDARLWVIFDCCHAGDMTRGVGEQQRSVRLDDAEGLAIPGEAVRAAQEKAATRDIGREDQPEEGAGRVSSLAWANRDGIAILYACQPNEKTIEHRLPLPGYGEHFGILTYSLHAVLSKASGKLSYQELGKRIYLEYIRLGRMSEPTPLVEGGDMRRACWGER